MSATLNDVKAHLHIFHNVEDEYLSSLLLQSKAAVTEMTGISDGPQFDELVLNRVRFAYNDKLDEFEKRYRSVLMSASLGALSVISDVEVSGDES